MMVGPNGQPMQMMQQMQDMQQMPLATMREQRDFEMDSMTIEMGLFDIMAQVYFEADTVAQHGEFF